jgi:acyl dehydratase
VNAGYWAGRDLGQRTVSYTHRDAILYALAVGARADELDLVFEERLRVLPAFGLTLAQWAPDVLAEAGAFDNRAVHGSQKLEVHQPLPIDGELVLTAQVGDVWDKGSAAVFDVTVECEQFTATWSLFAPGFGDFGGQRGPARAATRERLAPTASTVRTYAEQAVLYRLLGDRHHIHVDPAASARIGQERPILHGLATLATAALSLARLQGAHPADLTRLEGRFSGPVIPGDELAMSSWPDGTFELSRQGAVVISEAVAVYA